MEDFILNEIMDTQEETSMPIADDDNVDGDENFVRADAEDNCPNTDEYNHDPYQSQEPYYDFFKRIAMVMELLMLYMSWRILMVMELSTI